MHRKVYSTETPAFMHGDTHVPVKRFTLNAKGYYVIYKQVLTQKTFPNSVDPAPLKKGVELYLNYLYKDSNLMLYIQKHQNVPETELVTVLLEKFKEYGLGDRQYIELIKAHRETRNKI